MAQGFAGKRCFLTGAASGIGRSTALKLAADGAELYPPPTATPRVLPKPSSDARALGAAVVSAHRALDISNYDEVAAFAADIHGAHQSNGPGDEHRRSVRLGYGQPPDPSALGVDGLDQLDGAHPRHRNIRSANGSRR